MGLPDFYGCGQVGFKDPMARPAQLVNQFRRQSSPRLKLIHHDALNLQAWVVVGLQLPNRFHEFIEGIPRKRVAIEGDETSISGNQGGAGVEIHCRRGVDIDPVKSLQHFEGFPQLVDFVAGLQSRVQRVQLPVGRQYRQIRIRRGMHESVKAPRVNPMAQGVLEVLRRGACYLPGIGTQQIAGGIALCVQVDDQCETRKRRRLRPNCR